MLDEGVFGELYTFEDGKLNEIKLKDYIEHYIGSLYKQRESGRGLLLTGGNGVGKTMIACIIVKCALWYSVVSKKKHPDYNGKFITFKEYIDLTFRADKDEERGIDLDYIRNIDFLIIDEIGAEPQGRGSDRPPDYFISVLDDLLRYRSKWNLCTLITSNLSPNNFKNTYKQDGGSSINRIWSIIEGKYNVIEISRIDGSYRNKVGVGRSDKLLNEFGIKKSGKNRK